MSVIRTARAGSAIEDFCRACKVDRMHTVIAADAEGQPLRVQCGYCRSEHNYRGGPRTDASEPARGGAPEPARRSVSRDTEPLPDLESLLRRVIREEAGLTAVAPAEKWRGGTLVLRPGTPGLQEKSIPIETFFHKIVMLRNRLRTLEQVVNASDLPEDAKLKLQAYISGCYGSLTTFNVLFADETDQFKGTGDGLSP
jgi:hypothetical protein